MMTKYIVLKPVQLILFGGKMKRISSRPSIRLTPAQEKEINELYACEIEKMPRLSRTDFLRDVIQYGLLVKKQQNTPSKNESPLDSKERELYLSLFQIITELGYLAKNSFVEGKTRFQDASELHNAAAQKAGEKLEEFIEELKNERPH